MSQKILFVDDDPRILSAFTRRLRKDFDFHTATDGEEALRVLAKEGPFAVVISDQQMPGMRGIELLKEVMTRDPLTIRIMLTGNADRETAIASVNDSAVFRYLNKPCPVETIAETVREALAEYNKSVAEKELLEGTLAGSVKVLVDILAANDPHAFRQISNLRNAGRKLASHVGLAKAWNLDMAITLSTIGDVMLPPHLRSKMIDGKELDQVETDLVIQSPQVARKLLLNIPRMSEVADSIYYKDKGFDGSGFPSDGVKTTDIPLNARILHVLQFLIEASEEGTPDRTAFAALEEVPHLFDGELVKQARACFLDASNSEEMKICKMAVNVDVLLPGDKAVDDFKTQSGELALSAGTELNEAVLERIRQFHKMRPLVQPLRIFRRVKASAAKGKDAA